MIRATEPPLAKSSKGWLRLQDVSRGTMGGEWEFWGNVSSDAQAGLNRLRAEHVQVRLFDMARSAPENVPRGTFQGLRRTIGGMFHVEQFQCGVAGRCSAVKRLAPEERVKAVLLWWTGERERRARREAVALTGHFKCSTWNNPTGSCPGWQAGESPRPVF